MGTEEPVEVPTEVLERIDTLLRSPSKGLRRERPQRQLEQDLDLEPGDLDEVDPLIAAFIKERLRQGLTQWDVAQRMGLASASLVASLEAGEVDAPLSVLRTWSKALGIAVQARKARPVGRKPNSYR